MPFWNFVESGESEVELRIEGEIVSDDDIWFYEWFDIKATSPNAFRSELASHVGKTVNVWIDSWGGDTTAAAGIYNALKEHKGKVVGKIDGKAVSAASIIAMACTELKMSPVGILMIHNPWTGVRGESKDMRHMADVLDEVKETLMNAYQMKTKKSRKSIAEMMDNETWMSPKTALAEGFIDEILYASPGEGEPVENSFMIGRLAIQNSANEATRRFIEQYTKIKAASEPEPTPPPEPTPEPEPQPQPDPQAIATLYQAKLKNLRRKQNEL